MQNNQLKGRFLLPDTSTSRATKTISLSLASMLSTLASLVLSMIMTRVLSKTDVAAYKQTLLAYQTLSPFLGLGISQGLYYILPRNENRKRAVIFESLIILGISGLVLALFILLGGNILLSRRFSNPQVEVLLLYLVPFAIVMIPASIISSVYVAENRVTFNAKFTVVQNIIVTLTVAAFVMIVRTSTAAIISYSAISVIVAIAGLAIVLQIVPKDKSVIKKESVWNILKYSLPLGMASMVGTLDTQLDKWIVSLMLSPEEFAAFSFGAHELPLIGAVTTSISTVILVDMVKAAKEKNYGEALKLFKGAAEKTTAILIPLMMLFMVIAEPFVVFMYTDAYLDAVPIFRLYLLYLPIRTVFYGSLLIAFGKSKAVLIRTCIGLVANAMLSVLLVYLFRSVGATIATIISIYIVDVPINLYLICKETGEKWYRILPYKKYGICLILSIPSTILCMGVDYVLNDTSAMLRLFLDTIVFVIPLILIYTRHYKVNMKEIIVKIKKATERVIKR